jgi:hypothetical protein
MCPMELQACAARSRAEYEEAMHAAWAAPGVAKIEDHITIGSVRSELWSGRAAGGKNLYGGASGRCYHRLRC